MKLYCLATEARGCEQLAWSHYLNWLGVKPTHDCLDANSGKGKGKGRKGREEKPVYTDFL